MHSIVYSYCPSSLWLIFQRNEQRDITQIYGTLMNFQYLIQELNFSKVIALSITGTHRMEQITRPKITT
jgi:hypothetical protein